MGRHEEAIARAKHALTLAPTSAILVRNLGTRLYFAHQHDAAIEQYRKAIELNPEYTVARFFLGHPYLAKGMYDEAIAAYREGLVLEPQVWNWWGWLGYAYALAGKKEEALQVLNHLRKQSEDAYVPTGAFARVHLGLGERDRFLTWLEEALDAGYDAGYGLQTLRVEPALDSLRSDPRFQSLLRRLNFPD
jgi:tetratricopeptide (TPR) repeat protein